MVSNHTEDLLEERKDLESKLNLAKIFLEKFTLSESDVEVLRDVGKKIDHRFFEVLNRIHDTRQTCHLYLLTSNKGGRDNSIIDPNTTATTTTVAAASNDGGGDGNDSTAGLDIDKTLARYEDMALKSLRRWVQNEIRHLSKDTPEFSSELKRAISELKRRPALYE